MNHPHKKPTLSEIISYYDKAWVDPDLTIGLDRKQRELFILSEIAALKLDKPKILDFGCGMGWLSNSLSKLGKVTGIDLSPKGIERAKCQYPEVTFVAGDIFEYKFPINSFDVIVSQEVIEHVNEQRTYLNLAGKSLKAGGALILTTPNKTAALNRGYTMEQMREKGWLQPLENWLTTNELKTLSQDLYVIRKICTFYHFAGWRNKLSRLLFRPRLSKWMRKLNMSQILFQIQKALVGRNLLGKRGLTIGLVAIKKS